MDDNDHVSDLRHGKAGSAMSAVVCDFPRTPPGKIVYGRDEFIAELANGCALSRMLNHRLAVLCIDLARFKHIKAAFGHEFGEAVIDAVVQRLSSDVPEVWLLTHLGGDEFALAVPVNDVKSAIQITRQVRSLLEAPLRLEAGAAVRLSVSVGASVFPDHGASADLLLNRADIAVCNAKENAPDTCRVYVHSPAAERIPRERQRLLVELHSAIEQRQFSLVYQPKMRLADSAYAGAEALVRWRSPVLGDVSPGHFIPIAEDAGLIQNIGEWVIGQALCEISNGCSENVGSFRLAVNVSAAQLRSEDLVPCLTKLLTRFDVDASRLEIEVTESALMACTQIAAERLAQLRALGASITLDDFGTGYSTFSHLKNLPITTVKIAPDFMTDVVDDPAAARLVAAMIAMAQSLGLQVVAEGVETEAQACLLAELGCDFGQGYFFARPMGIDDYSAWLSNQCFLPASS